MKNRSYTGKEVYIIDGPLRGNSFPLNEGITAIGRAADNDIRILDKDISRHHAHLIKKDDTVFVLDLASLQGVFIDGNQIEPGVEFEVIKESRIKIGKTILAFQKQALAEKPLKETLDDSSNASTRSLEVLLNVSNVLVQCLEPKELFDKVMDQMFRLLNRVDRGAIILLDKETQRLREVVSKVRAGHEKEPFSTIPYSRTIVKRAIDGGQPIMMSDTTYANEAEISESIEKMNARSVMCVPLSYKGEIRGAVYVDTIGLPEGFRKDDLRVLTAVSNTAAIAIANACLYEELRQELTERKRAERELREARKELEKEIEKRTQDLSKTIEFLKQEISDHMQAEGALRESEEKYRSLFQESRDAVFITTCGGAFVEVNQSCLDLFGYTRKETANKKINDIYPDHNDLSRFQDEIEKKGSVRNFAVRLRRKDATEMDCLVTATVRKTEDGRILGYHGIIREITEREQSGKNENEVRGERIGHR